VREVLISFLLALVVGSAINGYTGATSQPASTASPPSSAETSSQTQDQVAQAGQSWVIEASQATFPAEVLNSQQPVLVDFYATWCGPCKMMKPTIEQLANEYHGKAKVVRIDVDANPELAKKYHIEALPTFLLFSQGKVVATNVGFTTKEKLLASIDQFTEDGSLTR
jgi:thioredoxin 1